MKIGEVSKLTGYSIPHLRRLARKRSSAGAPWIPGMRKTKGGHRIFPDTPAFRDWLSKAAERRALRAAHAKVRAARKRRKKVPAVFAEQNDRGTRTSVHFANRMLNRYNVDADQLLPWEREELEYSIRVVLADLEERKRRRQEFKAAVQSSKTLPPRLR